ncbi:DNA repair protein RAD51 homolog 4 [Nelusetta ayraudi]|uniref:DNA repair protein RAD51 homolog 4 n=1 Tax=Nelusetta ayraudi TaxID=303726 RepID=UPI003F70FC9C
MVVLREGMCPGLEGDLVRDLRAADVRTVEDLVSSDIEDLAQKCSVSYKALFAIRRVLLAQHTAFPVSGADLYEELLSSTAILSSGNPSLDKLLDSGLYTGEITELSGGPGSGKSQVCFGVAVHLSYHLKQSVIFIDTSGGLSARRLLQMLQAETANTGEQMEALQRIHVFRCFDVYALLDCLYRLRTDGLLQASVAGGGGVAGGSVKAVIVDSVSAVIAPLLGGKQNEGMSLMAQVAGVLKTTAKDFNVAALVTNHVARSLSGEVQPGLGVSWSHVPRTRILLERVDRSASDSTSSRRSATLIKSSRQPCYIKEEFDLRWWSRSSGSGGAEGEGGSSSGKRKLEEMES